MSFTSISASETPAGATAARTAGKAPAIAAAAPGTGSLAVARRGPASVVTRAYATSPLRLLTPRNHGDAAWIYTSSFGGGFVEHDRVSLEVVVAEGAAAFLSSQASSKVYRSPGGTSARLDVRVENEAVLIVAPDPVVPFAGASFAQDQQFVLARSSSLILVDWVSSGRRESGERWRFHSYVSRQTVRVDEALVVSDAVALRQREGDLAARLGRFDVLATVLLAGAPLLTHAAALVASLARTPVEKRPVLLAVASPVEHGTLGEVGCLLRIAGASVEDVGTKIRSCLSFVPGILGDDPWARKW